MGKSKIHAAVAIALSVFVGAAAYGLRLRHTTPETSPVRFETLPYSFDGFNGIERPLDDATMEVLRADTLTQRLYQDPNGDAVWLFVAYFGEQNYGEQIHSPRNCLPGSGWSIRTIERVPVVIEGRGEIIANRMLIERDRMRQVVYYFFLTRMGPVASEYALKFELARAALTLQPRDGLFVRVSVPCDSEEPEVADRRAVTFLAAAMPRLSRGMPF